MKHFLLSFVFLATSFCTGNITLANNNLQQTILIKHYKSALNSPKSSFNEKIEALDSLSHYAYLQKNKTQSYLYRMQKAQMHADRGSSFKAYYLSKTLFQDLYGISPHSQSLDSIIRKNYVLLSIVSWQSGFYEEGLSISYDFLKKYSDPNPSELAQMYSNLGVIQMFMEDMSDSKKNHLKAMQIVREKKKEVDIQTTVRVLNSYAGWYYLNQKSDTALYYLDILDKEYLPRLSPLQASFYYNNLALIYSQLNNFKLAESYLLTSLDYIDDSEEISYVKASALRNLANLYTGRKLYTEAEKCYLDAIKYAEIIQDRQALYKSYLNLGLLYKQMNKSDLEQKYLLKGYILKDSVIRKEYSERSFLLTKDFEIYRIQKELEVAQLSNEKKLILLSIFGILLLLFLGIAMYMIHKLRQSYKHKAKNQNILSQKEQSVAASALLSIQKGEALKKIKQYCIQLQNEKNEEEKSKILSDILRLISNSHSENSWEEFRLRFDTAYPNFYLRLQEKHPDFTKGEKYFAALLALDINAKEIANLTQRSVRSVETYIYRIRKKAGITSECKTGNYFKEFLD